MLQSNVPYVKQYDEKGFLINPIVGSYKSARPGRRHTSKKTEKHMNNRGPINYIVIGTMRFKKFVQTIMLPNGKKKLILHSVGV